MDARVNFLSQETRLILQQSFIHSEEDKRGKRLNLNMCMGYSEHSSNTSRTMVNIERDVWGEGEGGHTGCC